MLKNIPWGPGGLQKPAAVLVTVPMSDRFDEAGAAFAQLCRTMHKLRAPGGCAWDAEQTMTSLKPYLVEEAFEVIDAIEDNDTAGHCEELGDLLLQVVFQSEIAQETSLFDVAAVTRGIDAKLIRRHPHVFAGVEANSASGALKQWEAIKAEERAAKGGKAKKKGRLDGIPRAMPGLLRAWRMGEKAAAVGFDWPDAKGSKAKVDEEWQELEEAMGTPGGEAAVREEMGDLLFALVNLCRHLGLDPEDALRQTIDKFQRRFAHIEQGMEAKGKPMQGAPLEELDALWNEAKKLEKRA
jgi:MazG family protein